MSAPGLLNQQYPFISAIGQSYSINNLTSSSNMIQFSPNAQPIAIAGLSSLPFLNSCDLASQLISPFAFNFMTDLDLGNGEKYLGDNTLSIRVLMSGKEVGSIIGKRGDNVKKFREDSMARINISDGNSPERIVTISGTCEQIHHAMGLMCKKLEDDAVKASDKLTESNSPILSIHLLIQPIQYTGIIGNGGGRMSQLKEMTDATILFGIEFLPNSSERLLNISGSSEAVASCILELCKILLEMPNNNYVVPYSPKPLCYSSLQPSNLTNGSTKMTNSQYGDNIPGSVTSLPMHPLQSIYPQSLYSEPLPFPIGLPMSLIPLKIPNPMSPYFSKSPYDAPWKPSQTPVSMQPQNMSREFFIDNEMIGCVIGRGGSTINEIRAISGAQIKISNCEDGKQERRINICGTFEAVQTAQLLINSSLELYKQSVKIKTATNTSNPIILSNPLLPSNYPLPSVLPQNLLHYSQQPYIAFNTALNPDLNISLMNMNRAQDPDYSMGIGNSGSFDHDSIDRYVAKMKSTQVNLDGSKNITVMKFKPY